MNPSLTVTPIILSGGSGTRLWPLSRQQYPKQYLPLVGEKTMLQETILRLQGLSNITNPVVVCNAEHRFLVAEQLQQIDITQATIILEPIGRNTAPAITAAAFYTKKLNPNTILLVLSADHLIKDITKFRQAIATAYNHANNGSLITFGIMPSSANTGYGYIKIQQHDQVLLVDEFVEKPNLATAQRYVDAGNYLWNSGIFMFGTDIFIAELNKYAPEIIKYAKAAIDHAQTDLDFIRLDADLFANCPNNSIDCALMEKTDQAVVVPLDAGWNDIGSWLALYEVGEKDENANVTIGDVICDKVKNTYINANHHMVVAIGVENLVIVDTPDATLIASQDQVQNIKNIISKLPNRNETQNHRKVYRPWGWYDSIDQASGFQVKKIEVNAGARLSLQKHRHRSEHWVVIKGTATITRDNEILTLEKNQSTYIPIGMVHSLANETKEPLEIIEIQCGDYLGEDDIERLEDIYGRN